MKIINCDQGTPEWFAARIGVITASMFRVALSRVGDLDERQKKYVTAVLSGMSEKSAMAEAGYKSAPTSETVRLALDGQSVGKPLNGLDYLMNQKRNSLRSNNYHEANAMVSREEWRTAVIRALHMRWQDMDVLENRLYSVGALNYQQGRIYVIRGVGTPRTRTASLKNPYFMLEDDSGDTFKQWLYS